MTSESTKHEMLKAKSLIQEKRYSEAEALLILIDHPVAEKWLQKIQMIKQGSSGGGTASQTPSVASAQQERASRQDYSGRLVISFLLLWAFVIPGIVALSVFSKQARKDMELANAELPGAKGIILLNRIVFWFMAIPLSLFIIYVAFSAIIPGGL